MCSIARSYAKRLAEENKLRDDVYWDPATGNCGFHARCVLEAFGIKDEDWGFDQKDVIRPSNIDRVLADLDAGRIVICCHEYNLGMRKFFKLPKDNRYGAHIFVVFKNGASYFVSQGYLHRYRSKTDAYTRGELRVMFERIMADLCDYDNVKKWGDLNLLTHVRYFKTPLRLFPDNPPVEKRRVHDIVLFATTVERVHELACV